MAKTPNLELPLDVPGHVLMQQTVKTGFEKIDEHLGIGTPITSVGGDITIPAGSTLAESLRILADKINPGV